jgi:FMN phosphatase YigB (HAD superfamily)
MIKGLFFDLNGTLIDILTIEDDNAFRITANFLSYYGIMIEPDKLRQLYTDLNHQQRHSSPEQYPEFDVVKIFRDIITIVCGQKADAEKVPQIAENAALVFRGASRFKLELYPGVNIL